MTKTDKNKASFVEFLRSIKYSQTAVEAPVVKWPARRFYQASSGDCRDGYSEDYKLVRSAN